MQSLILLFMFVLLAAVARAVFPPDGRLPSCLLNDFTAGFVGAQCAVLVYRVVVLREHCP